MEKIQSALAKARAERNTKGSQPAAEPAEPVRAKLTRSSAGAVTAAWDALPALHLDAKQMKRHRVIAMEAGREAAGVDMLRTRVLQQMRDNGWRSLAITSPTAACGKSTIALNLAMSLQRQHDLRTMLLELDLRRPSLTQMLGITRDISFAQVLEGTRNFGENTVRYGPNLAISANQRPSRDAAELLSGPNVPQVLSDIDAGYAPDVTLFDTPPMLVADDMMAVARHVDCVLLVAGAESTTVKEVDLCEADLASQTNFMGVVLNKCRYMPGEYGYDNYNYA